MTYHDRPPHWLLFQTPHTIGPSQKSFIDVTSTFKSRARDFVPFLSINDTGIDMEYAPLPQHTARPARSSDSSIGSSNADLDVVTVVVLWSHCHCCSV